VVRVPTKRKGYVMKKIVFYTSLIFLLNFNFSFSKNTDEFYKKIDLSSNGFSIEMEIISQVIKKGFKIKEIPIVFEDRTRGESTKTLGQYIETMARIAQFRLTMKKPKKR